MAYFQFGLGAAAAAPLAPLPAPGLLVGGIGAAAGARGRGRPPPGAAAKTQAARAARFESRDRAGEVRQAAAALAEATEMLRRGVGDLAAEFGKRGHGMKVSRDQVLFALSGFFMYDVWGALRISAEAISDLARYRGGHPAVGPGYQYREEVCASLPRALEKDCLHACISYAPCSLGTTPP